MRILITGFGPYRKVTDNPSARLAELSGHDFQVLDVAYDSVDAVLATLDPEQFDVLLLLGVDAKAAIMRPELQAHNWCGNKPDVKGQCSEGLIEEKAPPILKSTLWSGDLLTFVEVDSNLKTSLHAGDYVCNYVYYRALQSFPQKRVGFLHVPPFERVSQEEQVEILGKILRQIKDSEPESESNDHSIESNQS